MAARCLGLVAVMLLVISCARGTGSDKGSLTQSLVEAEARLAELSLRLVEKEKLVTLLQASACKAEDDKCRKKMINHAHKLRRKQEADLKDNKNKAPYERVRLEAQLEPPPGIKLMHVKFLPIQNVNNSRLMNRFLVASDTKTGLHLFNSDGEHLLEYDTGHKAPITALQVDFRPSTEFRVLTGSHDGEVRVHVLPGPVRPKKPVKNAPTSTRAKTQLDADERVKAQAELEAHQTDTNNSNVTRFPYGHQLFWTPKFSLSSDFYPARAEPLRGLSRRHHGVDLTDLGERPIAATEFVQKGRSYNLLVTDSIGRLSLHIKNGSISASTQLPTDSAPRCAVAIKTLVAICTDNGMLFFESKDRRMIQTTCTKSSFGADQGLPERPKKTSPSSKKMPPRAPSPTATSVNDTNVTLDVYLATPKVKSRLSPPTVNESIVSFVQDLASEMQTFAGTEDGRVLLLQVRGEKGRVRCTLVHDFKVSQDPGPVHVAATKGYVYAGISTKSGVYINVLNVTTSSRSIPPEISLRLPIQTDGQKHIDLTSDRHAGLGMVLGDGAVVVQARLEYTAPVEWDLSLLNLLRHPLLLGGIGMFVMWQMKNRKKSKDEVEEMLKDEWGSRMGALGFNDNGMPRTFNAGRGRGNAPGVYEQRFDRNTKMLGSMGPSTGTAMRRPINSSRF